MRSVCLLVLLIISAASSRAENDDAPPAAPAGAAPAAALARPAAITRTDPAPDPKAPGAPSGVPAPQFRADSSWATAGYNNDEIVYTILVRNEDTRILRCTAEIKGFYFENGQKLPVEDRQLATVFPGQQSQIGNWMGMDQASGAAYSVKCRPL